MGINKESGCYGNDCDGGHGNGYQEGVVTYSDLENVPCVVVMTGEERPHLPLPRSVAGLCVCVCVRECVCVCVCV